MNNPRLGRLIRREIARAIWSIFGLMSSQISMAFDENGVTIRVGFDEPHDLDGPVLVTGFTRSYEHYEERQMG